MRQSDLQGKLRLIDCTSEVLRSVRLVLHLVRRINQRFPSN